MAWPLNVKILPLFHGGLALEIISLGTRGPMTKPEESYHVLRTGSW